MTQRNQARRNHQDRSPAGENGLAYGLNLAFSNGRMLQIKHGDLSNVLMAEALWHGMKQKLVDAAAISRNPETGRSATVEDKFDAVQTVSSGCSPACGTSPAKVAAMSAGCS
jgi:hypothetical protein